MSCWEYIWIFFKMPHFFSVLFTQKAAFENPSTYFTFYNFFERVGKYGKITYSEALREQSMTSQL